MQGISFGCALKSCPGTPALPHVFVSDHGDSSLLFHAHLPLWIVWPKASKPWGKGLLTDCSETMNENLVPFGSHRY